ncbi:glycosyl transferase family 2 [Nostocales cyanobacterium HT-58-2]|nr:glycosyl transferase family 2 [Nostocales cyanobacterium HT-58-2]
MQQRQIEKLQPIELSPLPDNPLVSVLVPNYNYAKYIGKTIESALGQTYPHFELIICDDGSTDNSCEVIETYVQKDSRVSLIRKENGGIATALNRVYEECQGQIVCLLDSDDLWLSNKLQKVVEAFKSKPKCGFVVHNVIQIDGQGNFIKSTPMFEGLASGWMAPYALANGGFVDNIPPASALSFRREVTDLIFPLNPAMARNTDSLIYRIAPFITEIGSVPEVLNKFRLHGGNSMSGRMLTADVIEKFQVCAKLVHQEQKKFLQNFYGTEIADQLTSQKLNIAFCHECYLLARLKGLPKAECREAHRQLVTHPEFNTFFNWFKPHRWLVQWYLPDALFSMFFNQVYGSSYLKKFVKWLMWKKPFAYPVSG